MQTPTRRGYTLQVLEESEQGAIWLDERQQRVAVQWGDTVRYFDTDEWAAFAALVGRAHAQGLPQRGPGQVVPLR